LPEAGAGDKRHFVAMPLEVNNNIIIENAFSFTPPINLFQQIVNINQTSFY